MLKKVSEARKVPRGPTLLICGDGLSPSERVRVLDRLGRDSPETAVAIRAHLCSRPSLATKAMFRYDTTALAAVSCTVSAASAVVNEVVSEGLDTARSTAVSLSTALTFDESALRASLIESICVAAARRVDSLAVEPRAGRQPLQAHGTLDRRSLLHPWRAPPRRAAKAASTSCLGAKCGACVATCQQGAIRFEGAVALIDPAKCVSCGACVANCPTGAISMPGADLGGLTSQIEALLDEGVRNIRLVCAHLSAIEELNVARHFNPLEASVTVPCVAMVSSGLLLGLRARGAQVMASPSNACKDTTSLSATLSFVGNLVEEIGRRDSLWRSSDETGQSDNVWVARPAINARLQWREPMATYAAIDVLVANEAEENESVVLVDALAPSGVVSIDEAACSSCGACALACPTSAITFDGDSSTLSVDLTSCIACGGCARACPENAIDVTRGVVLRGPRTRVIAIKRETDSWLCGACGALVEDDARYHAVRERLVAAGANEELLDTLHRCSNCGRAPADSSRGLTL